MKLTDTFEQSKNLLLICPYSPSNPFLPHFMVAALCSYNLRDCNSIILYLVNKIIH